MATTRKGRTLRQDQNNYDGVTLTGTRPDSTGGTYSGLKVGDEVDILTVYGSGTSYTLDTIKSAVSAIGSATRGLKLAPGTWVISDNYTIPSNFSVIVSPGAVLSPAAGKTLTIAGPLFRYSSTYTGGAGTVTLSGFDSMGSSTIFGDYAADTGTADNYAIAPSPVIGAYSAGQRFRFKALNSNSGASTLAVSGLTAKSIVKNTSTALASGDIISGRIYTVQYDSTNDRFQLDLTSSVAQTGANNTLTGTNTFSSTATFNGAVVASSTVTLGQEPAAALQAVPLRDMLGFISGLILSNNSGDVLNDIDISAGVAVDSTGTCMLRLGSTLTKRVDASWAAGTNNGGLDGTESVAGTPDVSTWYHVWLIKKDSDGTIDALFSESATAPTMPGGYTYKRLIGSVYNAAGGDLSKFYMLEIGGGGVDVYWDVPALEVDISNTLTTAARTDAVKTPLGYSTIAHLNVMATDGSSGFQIWISYPSVSDMAASSSAAPLATLGGAASVTLTINVDVRTNTSSQVRSRANLATVDTFRISTLGYTWGRR